MLAMGVSGSSLARMGTRPAKFVQRIPTKMGRNHRTAGFSPEVILVRERLRLTFDIMLCSRLQVSVPNISTATPVIVPANKGGGKKKLDQQNTRVAVAC